MISVVESSCFSRNLTWFMSSFKGFASFCFIIGFILLTAAAVYISPLMCGSNNERKMIRSPEEIDATYSAYSENGSASAPNQV